MPTDKYKERYFKRLQNVNYARGLLKAAFDASSRDGNWGAFGLLLQDIVAAQGSKREFAQKTKVSRQHLYRLFSANANPTLKTLSPILSCMGLRLTITEEDKGRKKAA